MNSILEKQKRALDSNNYDIPKRPMRKIIYGIFIDFDAFCALNVSGQ